MVYLLINATNGREKRRHTLVMVAQPEQNAEEIRQMPVCTSDSALPSPYLFSEGKDLPTPSDEENPPTPAEFISEKKADPLIVTWEDYDMHENPRKWKTSHRLLMVIIVSLYSLQSPMTSSMTAPALDVLMDDFHVSSSTLGNMMMSIQVLAFAVGPVVFAPMSEKFGRKNVIQLMNLMYVKDADTQLFDFQHGMWVFQDHHAYDGTPLFRRSRGSGADFHECRLRSGSL